MTPKKKPEGLLRAVAYTRKSTKGLRPDKTEKQERSLDNQHVEIERAAEGEFEIVRWYSDAGVSGTKREKRVDYMRMLSEVKQLNVQAVIIDSACRFSRADFFPLMQDLYHLVQSGVHWWVMAGTGRRYDLSNSEDFASVIPLVCEALKPSSDNRDRAKKTFRGNLSYAAEGRQQGGKPAYGMRKVIEDCGNGERRWKGKIEPDTGSEQLEWLQWIFAERAKGRSTNSIAQELNDKRIPSPRDSRWYPRTVQLLLQCEVYIGVFRYGKASTGIYYGVNENFEATPLKELNGTRGIIKIENCLERVIPKKVWNAVQKLNTKNRDRRYRNSTQVSLSYTIRCAHCGGWFGPVHKPSGLLVYRCNTNRNSPGVCRDPVSGVAWTLEISEGRLLPYVVEQMSSMVKTIDSLLEEREPTPPPNKNRERLQAKLDKLKRKAASEPKRIQDTEDPRIRRMLTEQLSVLLDEISELEKQLQTPEEVEDRRAVLRRVKAIWEKLGECTEVPFEGLEYPVHPSRLNEFLHSLGCLLTLSFERRHVSGKKWKNDLSGGRWQIGEKQGKLPKRLLDTTAKRSVLQLPQELIDRCDTVFSGLEVA